MVRHARVAAHGWGDAHSIPVAKAQSTDEYPESMNNGRIIKPRWICVQYFHVSQSVIDIVLLPSRHQLIDSYVVIEKEGGRVWLEKPVYACS